MKKLMKIEDCDGPDSKRRRGAPKHCRENPHTVMKPKVLLTTVCRPFGVAGEGDSVSAELFDAQVTRQQGVFSYRQVIRCWGLDYIGENIDSPSVVLHYPSKREFATELRNHEYEYVGINFVVATFHKVKEMATLVRSLAPKAKIILGGYGTVLSDKELLPYCDLICREEGVNFMRKLLGEDTRSPVIHPYAPIESPRVYSLPLKTKVAHIAAGLGCPNGCDFCCTSHFFKRKYIPFVKSGRELHTIMLDMEKRAKDAGDVLSGFIMIDEDFFLQEARAREFLDCVRKEGRNMSIMGFGSVRGLSKFTADEIAEMGFDIIWTGFEGKEAHFRKLQGNSLSELYSSLRARGVTLLSSMIIGLPYQNKAKILEEFQILTELSPPLWQIMIYCAFPGTPLHKRISQQKRFLPIFAENPDYRTFDGFTMHFSHPHFSAPELEQLQQKLYRRCFETLGPSLISVIRVWFEGYCNLKDSPNSLLRNRAKRMSEYVRKAVPALYPGMLFGPNKRCRSDAKRLFDDIRNEMGRIPVRTRLYGFATVPFLFWTWVTRKLRLCQQPKLLRVEYPQKVM